MLSPSRISDHLRSNVIGYLALFCFAIGGTAYAIDAAKLKPNSVKSKHIKNGTIASIDVADGGLASVDVADDGLAGVDIKNGTIGSIDVADDGLTGADVDEASLDRGVLQARVSGECAAGQTIRAVAADGTVTCSADDDTPSGPAGGDLAGSYPNPTLAPAEGFHTLGTAGEPPLLNGWVAAGTVGLSFFKAPGFYRDRQGIVHLQGSVKNGGVSPGLGGSPPLGAIFQIPTGYRPCGGDGFDRDYVVPSGNVGTPTLGEVYVADFSPGLAHVVAVAGNNSRLSLDGITWRAAGC